MSQLMFSDEQALQWVCWWVRGARVAHPSWRLSEAINPGLRACFTSRCGIEFDQFLGMTSACPPEPNVDLLRLLTLGDTGWSRGMALVVTICNGHSPVPSSGLSPADLIWCRRLGKALKPGAWLPDQWHAGSFFCQGLRLLRAWVGELVWQRLRLHFDRDAINGAERTVFEHLPSLRLTALWRAVTWRSLRFF